MPGRRPTAAQELEHLESHVQEAVRTLAKDRRKAVPFLRRFHPRFKTATHTELMAAPLTEDDARLVVAREHGFESWATIRAEAEKGPRARWNLPLHERTDDADLSRAIRYVNAGDLRGLRRILAKKPALVRQRVDLERSGPFAHPGLLEVAAATHQRRGKIPPNLLKTTALLLATEPNANMVQNALNLAAAKPWPQESTQRAMIRLLIRHGANPEPAMPRAVFQGSVAALDELSRHGGKIDFIAAAAMGRMPDVKRLLRRASPLARRKALAIAAVNGQTESVRILLDAGLDPNRFNPRGFYEHSLPIHQAVWFDRLDTVKLFVERSADLQIRDKEHQGTPLGWATYGKKQRIARFLKAHENRTKTKAGPRRSEA